MIASNKGPKDPGLVWFFLKDPPVCRNNTGLFLESIIFLHEELIVKILVAYTTNLKKKMFWKENVQVLEWKCKRNVENKQEKYSNTCRN